MVASLNKMLDRLIDLAQTAALIRGHPVLARSDQYDMNWGLLLVQTQEVPTLEVLVLFVKPVSDAAFLVLPTIPSRRGDPLLMFLFEGPSHVRAWANEIIGSDLSAL